MNNDFALLGRIACLMIRVLIVSASLGVGANVAAELRPEICVDRYWLQAKRLIDEKDYLGALDAMDTLKVMSDSSKIQLPDAFQLMVAQAALPAGKIACARVAVKRYLEKTGRLGDNYEEALKLLDDVERAIPDMAVIRNGVFRKGCESGKDRTANDKQPDSVKGDSFEISRYEVTFEQYDRFVAATGYARPGDNGWGRGRRPVIRVYWEDAVAYTEWLSWVTGDCYRLPTEAEWEYAARADSTKCGGRKKGRSEDLACAQTSKRRAGNQTCTGDSNRVGYSGPRKAAKTAPVGSFEANPCGLYDMYGNVSEWVKDCRNERGSGAADKGKAPESDDCSRRVVRGGSWNAGLSLCRPEKPVQASNEEKSNEIGFRVVRSANCECKDNQSTCSGQNKASNKKRTPEPKNQ